MTTTEQAVELLTRWTKVAARDKTNAGGHGIKVTPGGRFMQGATRISHDAAVQFLVERLNAEAEAAQAPAKATKAARGPMTWERLNQATQDLFFRLCEEIQTATGDHSMQMPVQLGHNTVHIKLVDAPRLTNLKKVGLLQTTQGQKKSHKMLGLTDAGRAIWASRA